MSDPAEDFGDFLHDIGQVRVAPRYGPTPPPTTVAAPPARLLLGDCLAHMVDIPDGSIDAIITDPPYPEIDRPYGRMSESEWHTMMRRVVAESRRILKPSGSAVFVLQPNSETPGKMRLWLWEFLVWAGKEWGLVQDAYWWNTAALPVGGAITAGLLRSSMKPCVWLGPPDCYRDQAAVLWTESAANAVVERCARARGSTSRMGPSGRRTDDTTMRDASRARGGVTPHNVLPTTHGQGGSPDVAGSHGHPAGTPMILCDWWVRYICPDGGTVCDPFMGSGTVGVAAVRHGMKFVGIERYPAYFTTVQSRIADALRPVSKLDPAPAREPLPGQLNFLDSMEAARS